jgi:ribulose-phosphate 3-epimerase
MALKAEGIRRYLQHMQELMFYAHQCGVAWLTIEPMSCLAEPPTLPEEIEEMAETLTAHHRRYPDQTSNIGYCVDVSHGYADQAGAVRWDNMQLLQATLPYMVDVHLKNTDGRFDATFGFSEAERARGIVQIEAVKNFLLANAEFIPVKTITGYLELPGPKTGRDYSDYRLEEMLRSSLRYLRETFCTNRETEPVK